MPSPDLIEPTRLERLLAGDPPEGEREAAVEGFIRQLRAETHPAPAVLRQRVRAIRDPVTEPRFRPGRRTAFALAVVTLASSGAVIGGLATRGSDQAAGPKRATQPAAPKPATQTVEASGEPSPSAGLSESRFKLDRSATFAGDAGMQDVSAEGKLPFPGDTRAQDVDMSVEIRVPDADRLSDATNEAMRATRALGGLIVSSSVDTGGQEGRARLDLRIPVKRLEEAVIRFSGLGKVTSQEVATRDLQGGIDRRARQILLLQRAIERDKLILESGTLTPEERLEVQLRLARERARLQDARRERTRLIREAAMAELSLTLHTRAATKNPDEGGIAGAARDAADFLGRAGAVTVFALVALSPLLALGVILWALLRTRRRRLDDRLLERPYPAAPPHAPPS
jgi:uncharacterized protein DUF4349